MDNMKMVVMNLVTPILTERIMNLMTQTLTMRVWTMLMMTMMTIKTGMLIPVIIMDTDNSEDDSVNGDIDEDIFGAENTRTNNPGTDNADDDIDATDNDYGDAGSNENGDPNDIYAEHEPDMLSSVVHS